MNSTNSHPARLLPGSGEGPKGPFGCC